MKKFYLILTLTLVLVGCGKVDSNKATKGGVTLEVNNVSNVDYHSDEYLQAPFIKEDSQGYYDDGYKLIQVDFSITNNKVDEGIEIDNNQFKITTNLSPLGTVSRVHSSHAVPDVDEMITLEKGETKKYVSFYVVKENEELKTFYYALDLTGDKKVEVPIELNMGEKS